MKFDELQYCALLDAYKGLLTTTKAEIADMYFCCDLSLSEIAEIKNVTRQSVLDTVKSVKSELDGFENAVGFVRYKNKVKQYYENLSDTEKEILIGILEK